MSTSTSPYESVSNHATRSNAEIDLEERAAEIAKREGRENITIQDRDAAAQELLTEPILSAPEITAPELENVVGWESPDERGHRVPPVPLDDETNVYEQLVNEGLDEADDDSRASAGEEEPDD